MYIKCKKLYELLKVSNYVTGRYTIHNHTHTTLEAVQHSVW